MAVDGGPSLRFYPRLVLRHNQSVFEGHVSGQVYAFTRKAAISSAWTSTQSRLVPPWHFMCILLRTLGSWHNFCPFRAAEGGPIAPNAECSVQNLTGLSIETAVGFSTEGVFKALTTSSHFFRNCLTVFALLFWLKID